MIEQIVFFGIGAIFGSFFNVCIFRIPKKRSLIKPGSFCPKCLKPINWFDNIPIFGYIFLLGRCRKCSKEISIRYPLVEFLSGALFLLAFLKFGFGIELLRALIVISFLIVIAFIDYDTQYIYNKTTVPLGIIGLLLSLFEGGNLLNSILGVITGAGILYVIGLISIVFFKKDGMGGGDVYLAGALGAFLQWKASITMLMLSVYLAAIVGGVLILIKGRDRKNSLIPFGPFIAVSALLVLFFKDALTRILVPIL